MVEYMNKSVCGDISMTGYKDSYRMAVLAVQIHRHIAVAKWFNSSRTFKLQTARYSSSRFFTFSRPKWSWHQAYHAW